MVRLTFLSWFLTLSTVSLLSADFSGTWIIKSVDGDGRPVKGEITFREEGGALKAKLRAGEERREIETIHRESDKLSFEIPWEDETVKVRLEASGEVMTGRWITRDSDGPITCSRVAGAVQALSGAWTLKSERPRGNVVTGQFDLRNVDGAWKGTLRGGDGAEVPIEQLAATEDEVSFRILTQRDTVQVRLKLQGSRLNGTWTSSDESTGTIEGTK